MGERLKVTKTQTLLEEVRSKLGGVTDYRLAQVMEVHRQQMSRYHKGDQQADAYACARIALILERDPLEIIAEVEADAAKTDARRAFWAGFPSGLRRTALGVALSLTFGSSELVPKPGKAQSPEPSSHNGRLRQRQSPRKGAFSWALGTVPERDRRRPGRPA